ncbi:MAG: hypothetical protein ACLTQI_03065 [Slackia sp.]
MLEGVEFVKRRACRREHDRHARLGQGYCPIERILHMIGKLDGDIEGRKRLEETLPRCTEADYRMTNGSSLDKLIELGAFVMASNRKLRFPSGKQTKPCGWHQRCGWNR